MWVPQWYITWCRRRLPALHVSVDYLLTMAVGKGVCELAECRTDVRLGKPPIRAALLGEERREVAAIAVIHQNVE